MELNETTKRLRQELAANAHQQWSNWMEYLFDMCPKPGNDGTVTIPAWAVNRWMRLIETPYDDLTEYEARSDLEQADIIMAIIFNNQEEK